MLECEQLFGGREALRDETKNGYAGGRLVISLSRSMGLV